MEGGGGGHKRNAPPTCALEKKGTDGGDAGGGDGIWRRRKTVRCFLRGVGVLSGVRFATIPETVSGATSNSATSVSVQMIPPYIIRRTRDREASSSNLSMRSIR
jgi:hypothetical protein